MKKCFSDPAVFKQLETDCYNAGCKGQIIDCSEFPAAEYRYFARLCGVYAMFKSKAISLEQAAAEKQRLLSQYNEDIKQRFLYVDACRKHQEALRTALAVISAARSENVTEKTVLQKLNAMSAAKSTTSPQK